MPNIYQLLKDQTKLPWLGARVYLEGQVPSNQNQNYAVVAVDEDLTAERFYGAGQLTQANCTVTFYFPPLASGEPHDEVLLSNQLMSAYERIQAEVDSDLHSIMVRGGVDMQGGPVGPYQDTKKAGQMWGAIRFSYLVNRLYRTI